MLDVAVLNAATKEKYRRIFRHVTSMRIRDKRQLFLVLRSISDMSSDVFLPQYGLHCGEFACFQILSEYTRKEGKREVGQASTGDTDNSTEPLV